MRVHLAPLALLATLLSASVGAQITSPRDLTVTGPREKVERFVARQSSRSPQLATSTVTLLDNGRATAVVTLPAGQSRQELVRTVREARAAGLNYEYADAGPMRTRKR